MRINIRRLLLIIIPLGIGILTAAGFPILVAWAQATFTPTPTKTATNTPTITATAWGLGGITSCSCENIDGYTAGYGTCSKVDYRTCSVSWTQPKEVPPSPNTMLNVSFSSPVAWDTVEYELDGTLYCDYNNQLGEFDLSPGGEHTRIQNTITYKKGLFDFDTPQNSYTWGQYRMRGQTSTGLPPVVHTYLFRILKINGITLQGPTATPTNTPTGTATPNPACPGILFDGGMEEYPNSSSWNLTKDDEDDVFYRLNNQNLMYRLFEGPPYCGEGWHKNGSYQELFQTKYAGKIEQDFCWPGGTMYWQAAARPNKDDNYAAILLKNGYDQGIDPDDIEIFLVQDQVFDPDDWTIYSGDEYLPSGQYTVTLYNVFYDDDTSVYWDNLEISQYPVSPGLCVTNNILSGTVTPQATPTLCSPYAITIENCGFEQGDYDPSIGGWIGWNVWGDSMVYDHPTYGRILIVAWNDDISDPYSVASDPFDYHSCGEGGLYVIFKVIGKYEIGLENVVTGQIYKSFGFALGDTFQTKIHKFNIPDGEYRLQFANLSDTERLWIDDVGTGSGGIGYCETEQMTVTPGPTVTRTTTKTATITATGTRPTNTPTRTLTPTASHTPYVTLTPIKTWTGTPQTPTRTPVATWTLKPPEPTSTAIPTDTPMPTDTVEAGTPTSTEPPTYTPYPTYTPFPSSTPSPVIPDWPTPTYVPPQPPQQPPPSCYAACIRPVPPTWDIDLGEGIWNQFLTLIRMTNIFNLLKHVAGYSIDYVGGWIEYARCYALSFIVWCPEHTQVIIHLSDGFSAVEPWGTINEIKGGFDTVATAYNSYNWSDTGVMVNGTPMAAGTSPSWDSWIVPENSPYNGDPIDITGQSITYASGESSTECTFELEPWVGPRLSSGMCFAFTTLNRLGVLYWFQFIVDLCSIIILVTYVFKRWVNAGANG